MSTLFITRVTRPILRSTPLFCPLPNLHPPAHTMCHHQPTTQLRYWGKQCQQQKPCPTPHSILADTQWSTPFLHPPARTPCHHQPTTQLRYWGKQCQQQKPSPTTHSILAGTQLSTPSLYPSARMPCHHQPTTQLQHSLKYGRRLRRHPGSCRLGKQHLNFYHLLPRGYF